MALSVDAVIGSMGTHPIAQADTAWLEPAAFLGIVDTLDQPHEFAHHVAVEPGRPEGIFTHHPSRSKDHEVAVCRSCRIAWTS